MATHAPQAVRSKEITVDMNTADTILLRFDEETTIRFRPEEHVRVQYDALSETGERLVVLRTRKA